MMSRIPSWGVASLWALACCSCSARSTSTSHDPEYAAASRVTIDIDPYRELFIVHPSVVLDSRASSASDGPWSFRQLVAQLAGPGTDPAAFVESWLRSMRTTSLNGFPLEDRLGVETFLAAGTSAWPRTPSGALDLSRAPFRREGRMWNLNALIPPSPFSLLVALGINDKGQILCTDGQSGAPRSHGFLLTPIRAENADQ
jgi:hypothetical protein